MQWLYWVAGAIPFLVAISIYIRGWIEVSRAWGKPDGALDGVQAIFLHSGPNCETTWRTMTAYGIWMKSWIPIVALGRRQLEMKNILGEYNWEVPINTGILLAEPSVDSWSNVETASKMVKEKGWTKVAVVSSGYHIGRLENIYEAFAPDLSVSFQRAPSKSLFSILLEPWFAWLSIDDPKGQSWLVRVTQRRRGLTKVSA